MRKLISNTLSLSTVNMLSMVVSLIAMPIIMSSLGVDGYGSYIYLFIQCQFLLIIVNYSFDIYAIREYKTNPKESDSLVRSIIVIRFLLWAVFSFGFYIFIRVTNSEYNNATLCILILSVLPFCVSLIWYFQAIEDMKYIAWSNLISKAIYLLLVIFPYKRTSEYYASIFLLSTLISNCSLYYIYSTHFNKTINFKSNIRLSNLKNIFFGATPMFIMQLLVGILPMINANFAMNFGGNVAVTLFDVFNKISSVINLMLGAVVQAIYPSLIKSTKNKVIVARFIIFSLAIIISVFLFAYFMDNLMSEFITRVFQTKYEVFIQLVLFSCIFSFFVSNNSLLSRIYIIKRNVRVLNIATVISLLFTVVFTPFILTYIGYNGLFYGMILSQFAIYIFLISYYKVYYYE